MAEKRSDLVRSVTSFLREYINDRRRALRRGPRLEASLPFIISPLGMATDASAESLSNVPALIGHTRDLSETGLTLLLPSVRIGSLYLTDREYFLGIKLELPGGPAAMLTAPTRFEQLPQKEDGCRYLLGVRIIKMQHGERHRYNAYLSTLESNERRARVPRRQAYAPASLMGPNRTAHASAFETLTPTSVSMAFENFLRDRRHPHKS